MNMENKITARDFFLLPNLMSLLRIFITPVIIYFVYHDCRYCVLYAAILLILAGVTDFLDGYLARHMNQLTRLGLILDPVADKALTILLIVGLIYTRDFPVWAAVAIFARDIIIMLAGLIITRNKDYVPKSDPIGKYYFGSVAIWLGCYLIKFDFGQSFFFYTTAVFYILSSLNYIRIFVLLLKDRPVQSFMNENLLKRILKIIAYLVVILTLYYMYLQYLR